MSGGEEHRRTWRHGERVTVGGNVSDADSVDCKGIAGQVIGANPMNEHTAHVPAVAVELEDGTLASVPETALEKGSRRSYSYGLPPGAHARIFGRPAR